MKKILTVIASCWAITAIAQTGRTTTDLTQYPWKLWLDTAARWKNDQLFAPPVDIRSVPVNLPTGGWDHLQQAPGKTVQLPATVEQYYWGRNGNSFGVAGNYLGVSWFTTKVMVPATRKGQRITLQFESVRFRAEVFVNRKLVGYDLVNSTPFEVDITQAVQHGKENEIAVRITDPNGNFDWRDSQNFMWGDYRTQPTHGFGGITGRVKLVTTDPLHISDVFVSNMPAPQKVRVEVRIANGADVTNAQLALEVVEAKSRKRVWAEQYALTGLKRDSNLYRTFVELPDAKLWSVDSPHLYVLRARLSSHKAVDSMSRRFGFRWFEVRDVAGDRQFYLNGKRIVLRTAISWGFWPGNGIMPSDELARKQVSVAKQLGLNMLNFHRTIGQQNVLDAADELGLLYFEEPGGNQYPADRFNATDALGKKQADYYFTVRNEKLFRMIRRDRSHPSLVIYNLHNERGAQPQAKDSAQMLAARALDESRIITYNSSNGSIQMGPDPRFKLHLMPYSTTFKDYGWFDQHHAGGPGVYHDNLYSNPTKYLRYFDHPDEIIYYGEEGAIGTPPRLELIRKDILSRGKDIGWESADYLTWYDAYAQFLQTSGFYKAFPSVDALTRAMGNVAYYYQGRAIENIRISNTIDGYAVNGWESMKLENHSGIVDNYRNPKGDVELIARYNKPLFVAVKMNRKVLGVGDSTTIDLFIVNEKDIKGPHQLMVSAVNAQGQRTAIKTIGVNVTGGVTYGELLSAGLRYAPPAEGYTTITAELRKGSTVVARGDDQLFAVKLQTAGVPAAGMVADTTGVMAGFLRVTGINTFKEFKSGRPEGKWLLVGGFEPQQTGNPLVTEILEWVNEGNTLIVAGDVERWATFLGRKEVIDYRGSKELGTSWYGGNFFVKEHPLLNGLPQNCVFNWEYQCFAAYNKKRLGLRLFNGETVAACVSDHKPEVYSALSVISHGRGKIIISTLDIMSCLRSVKGEKRAEGDGENEAMNTFNNSQQNTANVVGQQLLLNMLRLAGSSD
ncbi:glycoside hydrolase family 2 protein [Paraflavitalea pollutisoli]|uniref:glycoside hydrolase family 2 protein n=1 Tax=Paraflavitalea pollutisoli TaxID=3034143 RepID=UPI0023EBB698|nr:sugar-binding domain-containing protein [Paraflavitalea sp. H1-2-19X]